MSSDYSKPMILANEDLSEGVYAASGAASDCYSAEASIHQRPQVGMTNYKLQVNAKHAATDGHSTEKQTVILTFNQNVTYVWSHGTCVGGDGTQTLRIEYTYHNNPQENIGFGEVEVSAGEGLSITGCEVVCG